MSAKQSEASHRREVKLVINVWRLACSPQLDDGPIAPAGMFIFFLAVWAVQMYKQPFLERIFNQAQSLAYMSHIFVMYAATMYLTGQLTGTQSTISALFVIFSLLYVIHHLLLVMKAEVVESLPWLDKAIDPKTWLDFVRPS